MGTNSKGAPQEAPTVSQQSSGDPYIDGILSGSKWAETDLTIQFPRSGGQYGANYGENENNDGFRGLTTDQIEVMRDILAMYESVSNLTFTELPRSGSEDGDIRVSNSGTPDTAYAYLPSTADEGGDIWIGPDNSLSPELGSYSYITLIHELGHALGLSHPFEGSGGFGPMPDDKDSMEYTVMSYNSFIGADTEGYVNGTGGYAQSLMMYDIAAIQHLYGANYNFNSGDTVYTFDRLTGEMSIDGAGQGAPLANVIFRTIWDGGGEDTYDLSNYISDMTISLQAGEFSTFDENQLADLNFNGDEVAAGNVANALLFGGNFASLIENVIAGAGNDVILGNQVENTIYGGQGGDEISSGGSADVLFGQGGDDSLNGGGGKDIMFAGGGFDTMLGGADNDELRAGDGNDHLYGENGQDFLFGDANDDILEGGDAADRLFGGEGNDNLYGGNGNDRFSGNEGGDYIEGGAGRDVLYGAAGDDALFGGEGRDILVGADGGDRFVYESVADSQTTGTLRDTILDFDSAGGDSIDLSGIDADSTQTGNQEFAFVNGFSGTAGELAVFEAGNQGGVWLVRADVDGDGQFDFDLIVRGVDAPAESDFIL